MLGISDSSFVVMLPPISFDVTSISGDSPDDGDRLLDAAELELNVDVHLVADRDGDVAAHELLEALDLRRHLVAARRQRRHEPDAVTAAQRLAKRARVLVGDGDRDAGQRAGLLVSHTAADLRRAFLRDGRPRRQTPPRTTAATRTRILFMSALPKN